MQTFCIHLLLFRGLLLSCSIVLFGLTATRLNKTTTTTTITTTTTATTTTTTTTISHDYNHTLQHGTYIKQFLRCKVKCRSRKHTGMWRIPGPWTGTIWHTVWRRGSNIFIRGTVSNDNHVNVISYETLSLQETAITRQ